MRKVALLLTALVLFSLLLPPPQEAEAQLIPWEEWSDFWWNVQVQPVGPTQAAIEPVTGQHGFRIQFWNGGVVNGSSNIPMRYYLRITEIDGKGWSASVNPTFVYQDWNEVGNATVWVNAGVNPSYIANITCQVEMQVRPGLILPGGFTKYANITFQVRSEPQRFLYFDIENPVIDGRQDGVHHVPVTIANTGNLPDTFRLSMEYAPKDWTYAFSRDRIYLAPGQQTEVNLSFYIPHQKVYIQYDSSVMLVRVTSTNKPTSYRTEPVVVTLSGFHLTLGQWTAVGTVTPSVLLLFAIAFAFFRSRNPCNHIPKPWKDPAEKKRLQKMDWRQRRKEKKLMKEEWKSARFFCQSERKRRQQLRALHRKRDRKQRALRRKILDTWRTAWQKPLQEWKKQRKDLRERYRKEKRRLLTTWKRMNKKIRDANDRLDASISTIAKPEFPPLRIPPRPGKLPKPSIPQYKVDERRGRLIPPKESVVQKIMIPLQRGQRAGKLEAEKIGRRADARKEKLDKAFAAIEHKLESEMERARYQIKQERKRRKAARKKKELRRKPKQQKNQPSGQDTSKRDRELARKRAQLRRQQEKRRNKE
ncbi:MAG: hypothetical protein KGY55_00935 [Candidatus Thermoplasmatota archaeon]|nr:hypothetical protein [Candidatus Thermoplasmatota archaeon]